MRHTVILLGRRIQNLRQGKKLSQDQLAESAGLSLKHLGELERGRGNPTLASLESLAVAFGISLSELFDFDHEQPGKEILRQEAAKMIEGAGEEEIRRIYRVIKALLR
jgi:transcriptional regulator with XRE-family HTH domain